MRDEYGGIGIEEAHDPEAWMEFHHQPIMFPGDPIVLEEQAEQPDEQMGEGEEEAQMTSDEAATSPFTDVSEPNVEPARQLKTRYPLVDPAMPHSPASILVWLSERIERRSLRGVYSEERIRGRLNAIGDLLRDCMVHQAPGEQAILFDVISELGDLTDDEGSPIHNLSSGEISSEFRQAHQAMQVGVGMLRAAVDGTLPIGIPSSGSVVTDSIADSLMDDGPEEGDNAVARYMRAMNDPRNMG